MSRKFDAALAGLRDTYPSPDPARMEEFLRTLPQEQRRNPTALPLLHTGRKPLWIALPAVAAAAVMLTVGIGVYRQNPQHSVPSIMETTTQTETVRQTESSDMPPETEAPSLLPTETSAVYSSTAASPTSAVHTEQTTAAAVSAPTSPTPAQTTTAPSDEQPWTSQDHTALTELHTAAAASRTTTAEARSTGTTIVRETTTLPVKTIDNDATQRQTVTTTCTTVTTIVTTQTTGLETQDSPVIPSATEASELPTEERPCCDPAEAAPVQYFVTVMPSVRYDVPEDFVSRSDFGESCDAVDGTDELKAWWRPEADAADVIVTGMLDDITYTSVNGVPYTVYSIHASQVIKGGYAPGDLTVYQLGGYIPLSELTEHFSWARDLTANMTAREIAETMVFETVPQPQVSDHAMLLFLSASPAGLPAGTFRISQCLEETGDGIFRSANGAELRLEELLDCMAS